MRMFTTVFTFVLVVVIAYLNRKNTTKIQQPLGTIQQESVKGAEDENNNELVAVNNQAETPKPTEIIAPTATATPAPTSSTNTNSSQISLSDYIYPGSEILEQSSNNLKLKNSADPDAITDWYKERIKSGGMNVKTFVTTKTNGNVHNELVGANSEIKIKVLIEKPKDQVYTTIFVTLTD